MKSSAKILGLSFTGLVMNSATCFVAPLWTKADYGDTPTAPSATQSHDKCSHHQESDPLPDNGDHSYVDGVYWL